MPAENAISTASGARARSPAKVGQLFLQPPPSAGATTVSRSAARAARMLKAPDIGLVHFRPIVDERVAVLLRLDVTAEGEAVPVGRIAARVLACRALIVVG